MAEIKELKSIDKKLFKNNFVSVQECGNILETLHVSHRNQKATIRKLNKNEYLLISTGEIKEFKHKESRQDNINAVRRSLRSLRNYINTNITDNNKALWITLTYAENMVDTKRLYTDFEKFIKRLRYAFGHCEYIVAMEPQGRGAWHAHLLAIYENKAPYIPNARLAKIWGNGFVKINLLKDIDNIGVYLTAYLGDMELKSIADYRGEKTKTITTNGKDKKIIKGGRLKLYPTGFNLYRISKGIKKPKESLIDEKELLGSLNNAPLKYEKILEVKPEGDYLPLYLHYRTYNIKDKKIDGL